jgi:nucleolar protein 4
MPKSTENTVFVRFVPTPAQQVMRHQLEDIFSQIGPIKKSSWINSQQNSASKGYGFVKYVSHDDAEAASTKLHNTQIQMEGREYTLKVELASLEPNQPTKGPPPTHQEEEQDSSVKPEDEAELKKKSRIILRNLSFYAKEPHIRKVMEKKYGKVLDVHLPRVQSNLHVGFCFVTFCNPNDAQKAVDTKQVDIQKRTVSMDWSLPKKLHQQQKQQQKNNNEEKKRNQQETDQVETNHDDNDSIKSEDDAEQDKGSSTNSSDSGDESSDADSEDEVDGGTVPLDNSLSQKRTLFLRNLPFDTTRHDVFQLFYKFGYIEAIYLVKDKETGMLKGTAFVTYSKTEGAQRAIEQASQSVETSNSSDATSFVPQRQAATTSESSLLLLGRKIFVDFAVDKETAATFDTKEHNVPSADRRNIYLQAEARVESSSTEPNANNANTWEDLLEQDQKKRQTSLKDKTTKLQSPIFFINPNRLSFRNMAKHVDESALQKLCEDATKLGLEKGLVGAKDQIAHWRALGDMSTRDILAKIQEKETKNEDVIPQWEAKSNIKEYVPSVYIDRDFGPSGKKSSAPSRGFGFAEFTHHTHALACLRELNNNPAYSRDYTAGGKNAKNARKAKAKGTTGGTGGDYIGEDGRVRVPRLIVDFVVRQLECRTASCFASYSHSYPCILLIWQVENKVKAKKQLERRVHQQLNQSKQILETHGKKNEEQKKKRSRGAIQRDKKKQKRESGEEEAEREAKLKAKALAEARKELREEKRAEMEAERKVKTTKPPKKKKKVDKDVQKFEKIVDTYRSEIETTSKADNPRVAVEEKRWFE